MMKLFLFFFIINSTAIGQRVIEGRVIDKDSGAPIPFASIGIVGTSQGTTSNLQGEFSLLVSDSASIKVTCLGYESQEINSFERMLFVKLKSIATQLTTVLITNKAINPKKIVRKAFDRIGENYDNRSFLQKFFYRHYSLSNSVYEKVIEASVDVWKHEGYKLTRGSFGEREEVRVNQLRRSLDITGMVQGQKPLWLGNILHADIIGYQTARKGAPRIFDETSNMLTDLNSYNFTFDGLTNYDGEEVYKIGYVHKKDSVLTTSGYKILPEVSGTLFITTDTYAFVKTEDVKYDEVHTIHTTVYYRKYGDKYYPYHLMKEGEDRFMDDKFASFHIELMSLEIRQNENEIFSGREPGRDELLKIPYDSMFWSNYQILKATPLEEEIIHDLGGGLSLNRQFYLYKEYELNVTDGGNRGEEKFNWLKADSKGKRALYIIFWDSNFAPYLVDMEYVKRLNQLYKSNIVFILISSETDDLKWKEIITKYNFFSDGIINYRIGKESEVNKLFNVKKAPAFILVSKDGSLFALEAKRPSDPLLEKDLKSLLDR